MQFAKHQEPLRQMDLSQAKLRIKKAESASVACCLHWGQLVAFAGDIINGQMEQDLAEMNDEAVELVGTSIALWFVKKLLAVVAKEKEDLQEVEDFIRRNGPNKDLTSDEELNNWRQHAKCPWMSYAGC